MNQKKFNKFLFNLAKIEGIEVEQQEIRYAGIGIANYLQNSASWVSLGKFIFMNRIMLALYGSSKVLEFSFRIPILNTFLLGIRTLLRVELIDRGFYGKNI